MRLRPGHLSLIVCVWMAAACADRPTAMGPLQDTIAFRQAASLIGSGRFAAAAEEYARVRDSFALAGDSVNQWYGELWWAEAKTRHGQPDSASLGLARAESLAGADPRRLGWVSVMRSKLLERTGRLDSAIAVAESAAVVASAVGDRELAVWAYDGLGTALSLRGRYREALAADSTSLVLRRAIPMADRTIAQGLNEVAIGYRHLGRYDEARAALEESYRIARSVNDTLGMALARGNISNVWDALGDRDRAVATLGEAIGYVDAVGHRRFQVAARNQIAAHFLETGNPDSARAYATRSLEIARDTRSRYGEVQALQWIGGADVAQGRYRPGRETIVRGIELADSSGFGADRVALRSLLVRAELGLGNVTAALAAGEAAVAMAQSLGDPALLFTALEARARALEAARSPRAAAGYIEAMDLLESIRGRLAMGDLQLSVAAHRLGAYEGAIRTLLAAARPLDAFHVSERARARLLLELMADRRITRPVGPLDQIRRDLKEKYESRDAVDEPAVRERLDREIAVLADSVVALEAALRASDPAGAARYPGVLPPDSIRRTLLVPGRALLAYFWGDSAVVGWWITADTIRAARLGSADSLVGTVEFLRGALERQHDSSLWRRAGARAYKELVAPLAPTGESQVLVIADGPLSRVPLESFLPDARGEPWGATRSISYGPSASVLAALALAPQPRWTRSLLAVGNPALAGDTVMVLAAENLRASGLGPLPHAEAEARAIHEIFRDQGADLIVGRRATVARWMDRDPGRYRYLHFALHAVASDRHPDAGALLFAGAPLDLAAVRRLRLQAELVTLSACETGVGRWVRGEGVVGMQHAFLAAGARGVVVTLWRVADRSTSEFMRRFYEELYAGQSPAAALANVRSEWINSGDERSHPWSWAPFVLVGGE